MSSPVPVANAIAPEHEFHERRTSGAWRQMPRIELPVLRAAIVESRPSPSLDALEIETGARWQIGWHPWVDVARSGWGGRPRSARVAAQADVRTTAEAFRRTHARLLGAENVLLRRVRLKHAGRAWHVTWQQWHGELRVLGSDLDLTLLEDGAVVAFRSTLLPGLEVRPGAPDLAAARAVCAARVQQPLEIESSERVLVADAHTMPFEAVEALLLVLRTPHGARWRAVVGSNRHELMQLENLVRTSQLTGATIGRIKPHYAHDPYTDVPLPWLQVQLGFNENAVQTFADERGLFQFVYPEGRVTVRSALTGRYVSVDNQALDPAPYFQAEVTVPGSIEVRFGAVQSRPDERTIYHHVNRIHDFMAERFNFSMLDFPVVALAAARDPNTGDPNYPNAYWDGEKLGFGNGGETFLNMGLFGDVVYHEYTHAVTQFMYAPGGPLIGALGGAIHEALADYFAATLTDDSRLGERLGRRTILPLRDLQNSLYWPDHRDAFDEVHANGEILGGALWDVRSAIGAIQADAIIHFARELFPRTFEEYLDAVLLQDDLLFGDGWPGNGSPHRTAILEAFALHGIGPLRNDELEIVHQPLGDTDDTTRGRVVVASVRARLKDADPFVRLSYRHAGTEEYEHVWMFPDGSGSWRAEIPPFPAGSDVHYYIATGQFEPIVRVGRLPRNSPEEFLRYHVGPDRSPPRITHVARNTVAAFAWPPDLHVKIEDNADVAYAYVEYRLNGETGAMMGLARDREDPDTYLARFPNVGGMPGDVVDYWITAVDNSQAGHVTRFPESGSLRLRVVADLEEGFEDDQGRWQHASLVLPQPDAWHRTERWNHTPGGQNAWLCGDSAGGDYPLGVAAALRTDWYPVDSGARARVWSWMDARQATSDLAIDGGRVEIQSEENSTWVVLTPRGGYSHTMGVQAATNALVPGTAALSGHDDTWQHLEFDLDAWAGQRVRLRFLFGSVHDSEAQSSPRGRGWLLDDFTLVAGDPDPTDAGVSGLPATLRVHAAPNPFNPRVRLRIDVPEQAGRLRLDIVDARGRFLRCLVDAVPRPGTAALDVVWDGTDATGLASASGVYYYRLHSKRGVQAGKLVLVR